MRVNEHSNSFIKAGRRKKTEVKGGSEKKEQSGKAPVMGVFILREVVHTGEVKQIDKLCVPGGPAGGRKRQWLQPTCLFWSQF